MASPCMADLYKHMHTCLPHLATGLRDVLAVLVACLCLLRSHGKDCDALSQPPARRRVRSKGDDACEAPVQAGSAVQLRHTGSHGGDVGGPLSKCFGHNTVSSCDSRLTALSQYAETVQELEDICHVGAPCKELSSKYHTPDKNLRLQSAFICVVCGCVRYLVHAKPKSHPPIKYLVHGTSTYVCVQLHFRGNIN